MFTLFEDYSAEPAIRGFLHEPDASNGAAIVLTHGAGGNCRSKLLVEISDELAASGFTVLRFDLPFRLARSFGPPRPGSAERDRQGLERAATLLRTKIPGALFLGGHSYGGRQASMLLAEAPNIADGLLLLSYPLHPPNQPTELRTKHFPQLNKPAFFVHGARDPFGSIAELHSALELIPGSHRLFEIEGAAHDLLGKKTGSALSVRIAKGFVAFSTALMPNRT